MDGRARPLYMVGADHYSRMNYYEGKQAMTVVAPAREHAVMAVRVPWGWVTLRPWRPK